MKRGSSFFHDHPSRDHPFQDNREEVVTSRCHGSKMSGSQLTVVLQIWQRKKKIDMYDFPVHN